jgi:poly(3-hydroxybutyrate) depolymerase
MSHMKVRFSCILNLSLGLMLLTAAAFAQQSAIPQADAARVLALNVGYGTAKATALPSLSADQKAATDTLEAAARAANAKGQYGEAMKNLHHAQAVVAGAKWTPLRQLNSSLIARLDHALPEPGQTVTIRVGQWYAPDDKVTGPLTATITVQQGLGLGGRGGGTAAPATTIKSQEVEAGDWLAKPALFSATIPDLPDGSYSLRVILKPVKAGDDDTEVRANANIRITRGLTAKMDALRARIQKTKDADSSAAYRVTMYDLASTGEINLSARTDMIAEVAEANAILDDADAKKDPWASRHGDLHKAYLSKVDNTLQPYRVFVPAGYDGSKSYPLVIALHGMGGDENSIFDSYPPGGPSAVKTQAEQRGYLVACPKGRGVADMYLGKAEQDVLDVLAEMRRVYKVDAQRIYLAGHSMGGYGTWSLSQAHPTIFAALAPISGGGNTAAMVKIAAIPQYVTHGDADKTVPVERSREMVAAAKAAHTEIVYNEVSGGSHMSVATPAWPEIFAFFDAHSKGKGTSAEQDR